MDRYEEAVQTIAEFLACRDVEKLDLLSVREFFDGETANAVVVFGNDLPQVADMGCRAWKEGVGTWLLFCGGNGHSTKILRERMEKEKRYRECSKEGSEAELFAQIAVQIYGIPSDRLLLDTCSSNCGENAQYAVEKLKECGISMDRLILIQDPLMQRRSFMSLQKAAPSHTKILNFAPFLPRWEAVLDPMCKVWSRERFLELLLGEIRRLRDDENGYGPNGTGFIGHVDIPKEVEAAWRWLYQADASVRGRC